MSCHWPRGAGFASFFASISIPARTSASSFNLDAAISRCSALIKNISLALGAGYKIIYISSPPAID
jgi:hypothetical protein